MATTNPASWLFVLGDESIWIMHAADGATYVYGPGELQQCFQFSSESARDAYQVSMTERLLIDGWILYGADRDRRSGGERRTVPRDTPDRRAPRGDRPRDDTP